MNSIKTCFLASVVALFFLFCICIPEAFGDSLQKARTVKDKNEAIFKRLKDKGIRFQLGPGLGGGRCCSSYLHF